MRTILRLAALSLVSLVAVTAHAREVDESAPNTSLSAAPVRASSSAIQVDRRSRKDGNVPAKYDVAYPVRDHGRVLRDHGAI